MHFPPPSLSPNIFGVIFRRTLILLGLCLFAPSFVALPFGASPFSIETASAQNLNAVDNIRRVPGNDRNIGGPDPASDMAWELTISSNINISTVDANDFVGSNGAVIGSISRSGRVVTVRASSKGSDSTEVRLHYRQGASVMTTSNILQRNTAGSVVISGAGNTNAVYTVDTTGPTATGSNMTPPATGGRRNLEWIFAFSEPVVITGFDGSANSVRLRAGEGSNEPEWEHRGDTLMTVRVATGFTNGIAITFPAAGFDGVDINNVKFNIWVMAGNGITDSFGNGAAAFIGGDFRVTAADEVNPTLTHIQAVDSSNAAIGDTTTEDATALRWLATFSEPITGLGADDFNIQAGGSTVTTGHTLTITEETTSTYVITLALATLPTSDTAYRLRLRSGATIADRAATPNTHTLASASAFSDTFTITPPDIPALTSIEAVNTSGTVIADTVVNALNELLWRATFGTPITEDSLTTDDFELFANDALVTSFTITVFELTPTTFSLSLGGVTPTVQTAYKLRLRAGATITNRADPTVLYDSTNPSADSDILSYNNITSPTTTATRSNAEDGGTRNLVWVVTFSRPVVLTSFDGNDIKLYDRGTSANFADQGTAEFTLVSVNNSTTEFTLTYIHGGTFGFDTDSTFDFNFTSGNGVFDSFGNEVMGRPTSSGSAYDVDAVGVLFDFWRVRNSAGSFVGDTNVTINDIADLGFYLVVDTALDPNNATINHDFSSIGKEDFDLYFDPLIGGDNALVDPAPLNYAVAFDPGRSYAMRITFNNPQPTQPGDYTLRIADDATITDVDNNNLNPNRAARQADAAARNGISYAAQFRTPLAVTTIARNGNENGGDRDLVWDIVFSKATDISGFDGTDVQLWNTAGSGSEFAGQGGIAFTLVAVGGDSTNTMFTLTYPRGTSFTNTDLTFGVRFDAGNGINGVNDGLEIAAGVFTGGETFNVDTAGATVSNWRNVLPPDHDIRPEASSNTNITTTDSLIWVVTFDTSLGSNSGTLGDDTDFDLLNDGTVVTGATFAVAIDAVSTSSYRVTATLPSEPDRKQICQTSTTIRIAQGASFLGTNGNAYDVPCTGRHHQPPTATLVRQRLCSPPSLAPQVAAAPDGYANIADNVLVWELVYSEPLLASVDTPMVMQISSPPTAWR